MTTVPTAQELIAGVDIRGYLTTLAFQVQGVASGAFFVMVYLAFLLAAQTGFRRKLVNLFPSRDGRQEASEVFERVRGGVEGYLWVQTVTGGLFPARWTDAPKRHPAISDRPPASVRNASPFLSLARRKGCHAAVSRASSTKDWKT